MGNPARKIKEVSDEMISWKAEGTRVYQLVAACFCTLRHASLYARNLMHKCNSAVSSSKEQW